MRYRIEKVPCTCLQILLDQDFKDFAPFGVIHNSVFNIYNVGQPTTTQAFFSASSRRLL